MDSTNSEQTTKSRSEMTDEEKKVLKEQKKAAKELAKRLKTEKKKAAVEAAAAALATTQLLTEGIEYLSISDEPTSNYGTYKVIQSKSQSGRKFFPLCKLNEDGIMNENVWVRARVHKAVFTGRVGFITLRKGLDTIQAVMSNDKEGLSWGRKNLSNESIVDVFCMINKPESGIVEKCSINNIELIIKKIYIVSKSHITLPLTIDDASRPSLTEQQEQESITNNDESSSRPRVTRDTRLDARIVDLRAPPHASLMRLQSGICQLFREFLYSKNFIEIHSPKLIAGASEGGSDVFHLDYFGRKACLAQSPQLYKQMAICSDFERVFEIGPVFRAEKSHTHRHLCEFTGLDLEMEIYEHYDEILEMLDGLFSHIFEGLQSKFRKQLDTVQQKWQKPEFEFYKDKSQLRLKWPQAIDMLRKHGVDIGDFDDLNTEKEKILGQLVKDKYHTDFFMLTHFPSAIRPFYTMVDAKDSNYSNSYDLFMRGEEIVSGAQRIHDVDVLKARGKAILGDEGMHSIKDYVEAFKFGAAPHGGAGIGLERVLMLFLGVENIRECCLFPRDPERLTP